MKPANLPTVAAYETKTLHAAIHEAFDYFNGNLFGGRLAACVLLLHRKRGARGYFWAEQWVSRDPKTRTGKKEDEQRAHEISLCPETFLGRTDKDILSTLVHEMAHQWQQEHGKPSRGGYHNKEWADFMLGLGLPPMSATTGDKGTGPKVSHRIEDGGHFDVSCDEFLKDRGPVFQWDAVPKLDKDKKKKKPSKVKYTCPECGQNAWAKPGAALLCATDEERMTPEDDEGDDA